MRPLKLAAWLLGCIPSLNICVYFSCSSSFNWKECLNNKLSPQGRAESRLCADELAFNKAHVYCWVGAQSMEGVWESRARPSHSSVRLASSTPTGAWPSSAGSWHTSQEDFSASLLFFWSFELSQHHFPSCFIRLSFQSRLFFLFVPLMDAKLPGQHQSYNKLWNDFCFASCSDTHAFLSKAHLF